MASSVSSASGSDGGATITANGSTVLPATNCSWEQVYDDGECVIEPRSCYDCLNTALASGEECVLTPLGLCRDISAYDSSLDYRRGSPFAGYPIHYNYFPEGNSTYCEPDDAKCSTCREKSFTVGNRNPSLYCTGADDCVCVAVCESDSWRNDTLEQLRELFNETVEQPVCPIADNDTYSYTASSSEAGSSLLTGSSKDVYSTDDECKWYQNTTYCDTPRSCYDCLNSPVYSGQACTITPAGYCASMTEYDYTYDYRRVLSMSGKHFFPSTNTSYCEANDPVCEECQSSAAFSSAANGQANLTAYCVGTDDCVCVAFCESSNWSAIVRDETCNVAAQATDSSGTRIPTIGIAAIILVSCVLLFAGIMQGITLVRKQRRRAYWRRQAIERIRPRRPPTVGLGLELAGWKQMRDEIICSERDQSMGSEESTSTVGGTRRLRDSAEDAPYFIIEDGDGYRPLSPGQSTAARTEQQQPRLA